MTEGGDHLNTPSPPPVRSRCCTCNGTGVGHDNARCRDCDGTGVDNHGA
ncbi:hypothetical protein [Thermostaphylospora chromogena]|uniref:Uncharacterized protein n=1 Tax=Thermostaphylospora chromogena TaxID=35622 RepID=A0A1H1FXQ6_9ACTN|nr:hypothetical protein [Thermostaphylospora chromogena]SDR05326.1 hypothetical protein SAMN04489764_3227 [Thermostaphylospora chromogena]